MSAVKSAKILGWPLSLLGLAFLIDGVVRQRVALLDGIAAIPLGQLTLALLCYCGAAVAIALAWPVQLWSAGAPWLPRAHAAAHLRAQVAKYIPGNVFHFAARHATARQHGLSHRTVIMALALESSALVFVALGLGHWLLFSAGREIGNMPAITEPALIALAIIVLGAVVLWLALSTRSSIILVLGGSLVLTLDLLFFVLAGSAVAALVPPTYPSPTLMWCISGFAAAWVAGYVVPGAPGGLGIRESILVLALGQQLPEATAISIALVMRGVTTAVDLLGSLTGAGVGKRRHLPVE